MELIDTHCHLYTDDFLSDAEDVIFRAKNTGVDRIYLPAIDSTTLQSMLQLEAKYPDTCFSMIGLHPCHVKENYKQELAVVEQQLQLRKFAGIGEAGLDFYWDKTFAKEQELVLRTQVEWAFHYKLPIILHTRNAVLETIAILKEYVPKGIHGIFHCFSGTYEEAKQIIEMGFYLGVGGTVTYKNSEIPGVIKKTGLESVVLETDAPYLPPVPMRGKRNESSYLKWVVEKISEITAMPAEAIAAVTTANAKKIFWN